MSESPWFEFTNTGTAVTHAHFVVVGPVPSSFTILERITGNRLVYSASVGEGNISAVFIDAKNHTVHVAHDYSKTTRLTTREWTPIKPGQTVQFELQAGNPAAVMYAEARTASW